MNEKQTSPGTDSPTLRPTKKQKELLAYIEAFIAEHGYSPSYREIMNGLNYTSVATVALHVGNLIKRGHLTRRDHSARSLEVVYREARAVAAPLKTNEIKVGEEKWLVEKVEHRFAEAEAGGADQATLDDLSILIGALKVLGLEGAAGSFTPRLSALRATQATDSVY